MESKRSDGILVIGIVGILFGIWSLLQHIGSGLQMLRDPLLYSHVVGDISSKAAQLSYFESIYGLIIFPLFIVGGFSILKMRSWGRILLVVISAIDLVISLLIPYLWVAIMANQNQRATFMPSPVLIFFVVNIWFLNKKRIRDQFT